MSLRPQERIPATPAEPQTTASAPAPRPASRHLAPRPGGPLRFRLDKKSRTPLYEQIREQIISALHVGQIQPGMKLPSVRQFARIHQVNPKTIHRIYQHLAADGYVELRAGSGAYIGPVRRGTLDGDRLLTLHRFFQNTVEECARVGLDPAGAAEMFSAFVSRQPLWNSQVAVVESSREQVDLLAHELRSELGVRATPVLLRTLTADPEAALERAQIIVTTDHHFEAVRHLAADSNKPILQVHLHAEFAPTLMRAAQEGHLMMVMSDTDGLEGFVRAIELLGLDQEAKERIHLVDARDTSSLRREAGRADFLYVSPLVSRQVDGFLPARIQRLLFEHHLAPESLDLIEAAFLFGSGGTASSF